MFPCETHTEKDYIMSLSINKLALALASLNDDQRISLQLMLAVKLPTPKPETAKPKGTASTTVKHLTMLEAAPETAKPVKAPKPETVKPFTAVIREPGLIVVTFADKGAYTAHKGLLGDAFRFSGATKEWRASLAWVQKNQPQILKGLGLAK